MLGVDVFIGDQLCNVINEFKVTESFGSLKRKEGNGFRVVCTQPITGNSVKLVSKNAPREGEHYTAGLAFCDIRVVTTAKEPSNHGGYGLDDDGKRDFVEFPAREDYYELLQNTKLAEGRNVSMFALAEYDVEDRN